MTPLPGAGERRRAVYCEADDLPVQVTSGAGIDADTGTPTRLDVDSDADTSMPATLPATATITSEDVARTLSLAAERAAQHLQRLARRCARHGDRAPAWGRLQLDAARYCVIDLETTGTAASAEILEVGIVQVQRGELGLELATLVQPAQPVTAASYAVHGISDRDVAGAPALGVALDVLVEMARGRVLVFHNAGFDLGFIQAALLASGCEPLDAPVLDTVVLSRHLLGGRCGLGSAGARLGIAAPHLHRALPDARLTALLLLRLLAILHDAGAQRLADVPGMSRRGPRARRAVPVQPLRDRLQRAIGRGETLAIEYRAAPGLVPLALEIRPLRLAPGSVLARRDDGVEIEIDLGRIDRVRALKERLKEST